MSDQFSTDDEHAGHARLLANIRAEQVRDQPEPDHEPWWVDDSTLCETRITWCCDWHQHHAQETTP